MTLKDAFSILYPFHELRIPSDPSGMTVPERESLEEHYRQRISREAERIISAFNRFRVLANPPITSLRKRLSASCLIELEPDSVYVELATLDYGVLDLYLPRWVKEIPASCLVLSDLLHLLGDLKDDDIAAYLGVDNQGTPSQHGVGR